MWQENSNGVFENIIENFDISSGKKNNAEFSYVTNVNDILEFEINNSILLGRFSKGNVSEYNNSKYIYHVNKILNPDDTNDINQGNLINYRVFRKTQKIEDTNELKLYQTPYNTYYIQKKYLKIKKQDNSDISVNEIGNHYLLLDKVSNVQQNSDGNEYYIEGKKLNLSQGKHTFEITRTSNLELLNNYEINETNILFNDDFRNNSIYLPNHTFKDHDKIKFTCNDSTSENCGGLNLQHNKFYYVYKPYDNFNKKYSNDYIYLFKDNDEKNIISITKANPCILTLNSEDISIFKNGDKILLSNIEGMIELNDKEYYITVNADNNQLTIFQDKERYLPVDSSGYTEHTPNTGKIKIEFIKNALSEGNVFIINTDEDITNDSEATVDYNKFTFNDSVNLNIEYNSNLNLELITVPPHNIKNLIVTQNTGNNKIFTFKVKTIISFENKTVIETQNPSNNDEDSNQNTVNIIFDTDFIIDTYDNTKLILITEPAHDFTDLQIQQSPGFSNNPKKFKITSNNDISEIFNNKTSVKIKTNYELKDGFNDDFTEYTFNDVSDLNVPYDVNSDLFLVTTPDHGISDLIVTWNSENPRKFSFSSNSSDLNGLNKNFTEIKITQGNIKDLFTNKTQVGIQSKNIINNREYAKQNNLEWIPYLGNCGDDLNTEYVNYLKCYTNKLSYIPNGMNQFPKNNNTSQLGTFSKLDILITENEIDSDSGIITFNNHNLQSGESLLYKVIENGINNLQDHKIYYIYRVNDNQFKLKEKYQDCFKYKEFTASGNIDRYNISNHGFADNDPITITNLSNNTKNSDITNIKVRNINTVQFLDEDENKITLDNGNYKLEYNFSYSISDENISVEFIRKSKSWNITNNNKTNIETIDFIEENLDKYDYNSSKNEKEINVTYYSPYTLQINRVDLNEDFQLDVDNIIRLKSIETENNENDGDYKITHVTYRTIENIDVVHLSIQNYEYIVNNILASTYLQYTDSTKTEKLKIIKIPSTDGTFNESSNN